MTQIPQIIIGRLLNINEPKITPKAQRVMTKVEEMV